MGKQILVLAGSPREDGNSLELAEAFAQAARKRGHEVEIVRTAALKIGGCRACGRCWTGGKPCVQEDDMRELYPKLNLADVVLFASPIYFYGMPAQLKTVIDRFYPLCQDDKKNAFAGKESALILCGTSEYEDDYEAAMETYELMCEYLDWNDIGIIIAAGLSNPGDAEGSEWAQAARDLAMDL